jgi:hypothetical protein
MLKNDSNDSHNNPEELAVSLLKQAETRFGRERAVELRPEIETMAGQLAMLLATPVDLQDEP